MVGKEISMDCIAWRTTGQLYHYLEHRLMTDAAHVRGVQHDVHMPMHRRAERARRRETYNARTRVADISSFVLFALIMEMTL